MRSFAGHALVPEWTSEPDAYLVTPDLDETELRSQPDRGLRLTFLQRDVFSVFAGTSFLVLDYCQAGLCREAAMRHHEAMRTYRTRADRHSALLACRADASARETDEWGHGQLTFPVLNASLGAAAGSSAPVSFAGVANYVVDQGMQPRPGVLLQNGFPAVAASASPPTSTTPPGRRPGRPARRCSRAAGPAVAPATG